MKKMINLLALCLARMYAHAQALPYMRDLDHSGFVNVTDLLMFTAGYATPADTALNVVPAIQNFYGVEGAMGYWQSLSYVRWADSSVTFLSEMDSARFAYRWTTSTGHLLSTTTDSGLLGGPNEAHLCQGAQWITLSITDIYTAKVYTATVPCYVTYIYPTTPPCPCCYDFQAFTYDPYAIAPMFTYCINCP